MKKQILPAVSFAMALCWAVPASGALLAYEGFSGYSLSGGLNGVAGQPGTGINYWEGNNNLFRVIAGGLDYGLPTAPNYLNMSSGGTHMYAWMNTTAEGPFGAYRDAQGRIGADGKTLYISFLFKVDNAGELLTSGTVQSVWKFRRSSSNSEWGIGQPWQGSSINFNTTPILPLVDRKTHFIILKVQYAAGADTVTVWLDPLLGGAEGSYTPTLTTTTDASFDQLHFLGQGNNYYVDEIRFGETFDDVTANIRLSPPAAPVDLTVNTLSDTQFVVTWKDFALNETGFRVERAPAADGPWTALPDFAPNTTSFIDEGLTASTTYFYRAYSFNSYGDSTATAVVSQTTLSPGLSVPLSPGSLVGPLVNRNVALSWTDAAFNETGYRVYRAVGAGNYMLIAEIAAGSTSFIDQDRPVGQALHYKVTAFNGLGESLPTLLEVAAVPSVNSGADWVWIEGENFTSTTFPGNGNSWLSPTTAEQAGLSNGDNFSYLPNQAEKDAGFIFNYNIKYNVTLPADGEYLLYVRRTYNYGVFKWRIDNGPWSYVDNTTPNIESVTWRNFFPLSWTEGGSTNAQAGARVLEIVVNPAVDFPNASDAAKSNYLFDCFLLTQVPFSPAGLSKPGDKYARANAGMWPFEPSFDNFGESAIDLSHLNEDVAGQNGWVTRRGSEFFLGDGSKVRFFGATVQNGTFSSYSAQARFLAKRGFNIVRWHDSIDDRSTTSTSASNVDDAKIRQAQQCVAAFKQHGIYTNLSYFFILGHRVRAAWGIPGYDLQYTLNNDRAPFGIFFFSDDFKNAYKDWVRELLTRPNPWAENETPLGQDTAIAMIELLNEDNLFFFTFNPSNYPEAQRQILELKFGDWLTAKYGSLADAGVAWGGATLSRDNIAEGRMEVQSAATLRAGTTAARLRQRDQVEFMAHLQTSFWTEMRDYIRSLGCQALVIPTNWKTANDAILRDMEYSTYAAVDIVDLHNYFSSIGTSALDYAVSAGDVYQNVSAIDRPAQISVAYKQVEDRPSIISEFTWTSPTDMSAEAPLITAAYSALQDVDGLFWFSYGASGFDNTYKRWMVGRPNILGQFPGTALLYRRGDVAEAPVAFREGRSLESLRKMDRSLIVQGSGFDPTRDTGWTPESGSGVVGMQTTLVGKVELAFGEDWDYMHPDTEAAADYTNGVFTSLTGQVELNTPEGLVKVNSPLAQGATGYMGDNPQLAFDDCVVTLNNDFGSVLVISLDGLPLSRSGKVLVQVGVKDNPYEFTTEPAVFNTQPATKILSLGTLPYNVEIIDGEVVLKGYAGAAAAILDINGYPVGAPITTAVGGDLRLKLPFNSFYTLVTREAADAAPAILSQAIPSIVVAKPYAATLHASGGDGAYTWSLAGGSLPFGISLSADGELSGQTAALYADPVTVRVTDGQGRSAQAVLPVAIVSDAGPFMEGWVEDDQLGTYYGATWRWGYSLFMGWFEQASYPWIHTPGDGWMVHVAGTAETGLWLYSPTIGWIFVPAGSDGLYYHSSGGSAWQGARFLP